MAAGQLRPGRAFPGASAKFGSGKPARAVDGTGEMPQTETNAPALGAALPWGLPAPRTAARAGGTRVSLSPRADNLKIAARQNHGCVARSVESLDHRTQIVLQRLLLRWRQRGKRL